MSFRRRIFRATRVRRIVQVVFLLLFLALVVVARPQPGVEPSPLWKSFFLIDPLLLIVTWLAAHAVPATLLLSLIVIAVTVVLGRVFCGWVCPLGTVQAVATRLFAGRRRRRPRTSRQDGRWSRWQLAKYYLLMGMLTAAVFGGHWVCIFDPIVLLYRTTTVAVLPGVQWAVEEGSTAVYQSDPQLAGHHLTSLTEPVYTFYRDNVRAVENQAFEGTGLIVVLFAAILVSSVYRRRFWCRYLCPLGALLGLFARRPILQRSVGQDACNRCDLCTPVCHGAAGHGVTDQTPDQKTPPDRWKPSECFVCLACSESCPSGGLAFQWTRPWRKQPGTEGVDLSRRATLAAAFGGLVTLSLMRSNPSSRGLPRGLRFNADLIRPPGARPEREFLKRCTACGLCLKVCPTGGLQPAVSEAGLEGIWTPRLVPRIGYCDYSCTLCGRVCPTEAIQPLSVEEKQQLKIGLASFDTARCIPYAYGRDCMVCEEHCPVPDKAIFFLEVEVVDRDGMAKTIKRPHVDPDLCIGCGICENVCVFRDRPAIRTLSAGEARHPANQPILPGDDLYY